MLAMMPADVSEHIIPIKHKMKERTENTAVNAMHKKKEEENSRRALIFALTDPRSPSGGSRCGVVPWVNVVALDSGGSE